MNKLQENLDEILRQKNEVLIPENVREGIKYFGQVGTMKSSSGSIVEQTPIHIHRDATEGAEISVDILSGGGEFDFIQTADGWIQNTNQNQDDTVCESTIKIVSSEECDIAVDIMQDSENDFDYGTLNGESYKGKSGNITQMLHLNAGQNLLDISYSKDGSVSNGADTFKIKLNTDNIEGQPAFDADVLVYQYPSEASLLRDASKPEYTLGVVYPSLESLKSKIYQRIDNKWVFVGVANDDNLAHYNIKRGIQIGDIYGSFGSTPSGYRYDTENGDYVRSVTMDINLGDIGTIQNVEYRVSPSGRTYVKFRYFTNADIDVLVNGLKDVLTNTNGMVETFEFDVSSIPGSLSQVFNIDYGFIDIPFNITVDEHVSKYIVPFKSERSHISYSPKFKRLDIFMDIRVDDEIYVQDNVLSFGVFVQSEAFTYSLDCSIGNAINIVTDDVDLDYEPYIETGINIVINPHVLHRVFTNLTGLPINFVNEEEDLTCFMPEPIPYNWNDGSWHNGTHGLIDTEYTLSDDGYTTNDYFRIRLKQNLNMSDIYMSFSYKFIDIDSKERTGNISLRCNGTMNTVDCSATGLNVSGPIAIEINDFVMSENAEMHTYADNLPISIKRSVNQSEEICTATVTAVGNQFDGVNVDITVPQSEEQNDGYMYLQMVDSGGVVLQTQTLYAGSTTSFTISDVNVSIFENIENFRWLGRRMWRITDFTDMLGSDVTVENDFEATKPLNIILQEEDYGIGFENPVLKFYRGNLFFVGHMKILDKQNVQDIFMPMPQFDYYRIEFNTYMNDLYVNLIISGTDGSFNIETPNLIFDMNTIDIFNDTIDMFICAKYDKRNLIPAGSTGLVYYNGENRVYTYMNGFVEDTSTVARINIAEGMTLDEIMVTADAYLKISYVDNNFRPCDTYLDMSTFEYVDAYFNSNNNMLGVCENPFTGEKLCYNTYTGIVIKTNPTWHEEEIKIYKDGNSYTTAYYDLLSPTMVVIDSGIALVRDNEGYVYSPYLEEGDTFTDDDGDVITIRSVKYGCDNGSGTTFYFDVDFTESKPELTGMVFLSLVMYDIDGIEVVKLNSITTLENHKGTVSANIPYNLINVARFNVNINTDE